MILLSDGMLPRGFACRGRRKFAERRRSLLAVGLGSAKPPHDIELADVLVDDVVFVNDLVSLQAQIKATGLEGQPAKVMLRREGRFDAGGGKVDRLPAAGKTLSVHLTDRPTKPGDSDSTSSKSPRATMRTKKEQSPDAHSIRSRREDSRAVGRKAIRITSSAILKTLLERDHPMQLSTYLQDADPEYAEQDKTALRQLPAEPRRTLAYDVLIIGDVDPRLLPQSVWQNVRAFVAEKGGGAVFIAGPQISAGGVSRQSGCWCAVADEIGFDTSSGTAGRRRRPVDSPFGRRRSACKVLRCNSAIRRSETRQIWNKLAPLYWFDPELAS